MNAYGGRMSRFPTNSHPPHKLHYECLSLLLTLCPWVSKTGEVSWSLNWNTLQSDLHYSCIGFITQAARKQWGEESRQFIASKCLWGWSLASGPQRVVGKSSTNSCMAPCSNCQHRAIEVQTLGINLPVDDPNPHEQNVWHGSVLPTLHLWRMPVKATTCPDKTCVLQQWHCLSKKRTCVHSPYWLWFTWTRIRSEPGPRALQGSKHNGELRLLLRVCALPPPCGTSTINNAFLEEEIRGGFHQQFRTSPLKTSEIFS